MLFRSNILKKQRWSCTWRYAGGIVADMRQQGDYIEWYCSGIKGTAGEDEIAEASAEDRARYNWIQENFVSEGHITDEIREDLFKLGWLVAEEDEE